MDEEHRSLGRGRSAKKRQAQEIARLAARLAELPEATVTSLPLDEDLRAELDELRRVTGRSSKKRALKYFAGLLRSDDDAREAIERSMSQRDASHGQQTANSKELERLREKLCAADEREAALQLVHERYPSVDTKALRRLIKSVEHSQDKRAYREIFRRLRDAQES